MHLWLFTKPLKLGLSLRVSNRALIKLDAYFLSNYKNFWKDEEINITFYVSKDIIIYFDNSTKNFLNDVENETNIYDKEMVNHHFIMTNKTLKCTDCIEELESDKTIEKESI